jgi:MOSC domain-containing protein YiiM/GNAT superfamily N-acetyltransferase
MTDGGTPLALGRVVQVNIGPGGVPKHPVERAWVGVMGLEGDRQREDTVHGGPGRAVCLFALEAIERLQSEGHPTEPGGVGENLTTWGIEWSLLPIGAIARVGEEVVLEVSKPANPCATQRPNFHDGRYGRISIEAHPSDSRMYARVLAEGVVRPGDAIAVYPPPDSHGEDQFLLDRIDAVETEANVRSWKAGRGAGIDVRMHKDGELLLGACPERPIPQWNHVFGLRTLPHKMEEAFAFFREHASLAWFAVPFEPWPAAVREFTMSVLGADAREAAAVAATSTDEVADGVRVRRITLGDLEDDLDRLTASRAFLDGGHTDDEVRIYTDRLLQTPGVTGWVVEDPADGRIVGGGVLHRYHRVGFLRAGWVAPEVRGRGLQRVLIAARVRHAIEEGCREVASHSVLDSTSERNLVACGFRRIETRGVYVLDPYPPLGGSGATR